MPRIHNWDGRTEIMDLIWAIFDSKGRFKGICEMCGDQLTRKKAEIHHTKYEGAALKDLMIVCHKCNTQSENKGFK